MKKICSAFILLFAFFSLKTHAQFDQNQVNFEGGDEVWKIEIDTTGTNNAWQIGMPQKFTTNNAPITLTRGIITDTINSYPVSDTSVFEFVTYNHDTTTFYPILYFDYRIDSDSLNDFGKLEISPDNGNTWYDAIADHAVFGGVPLVGAYNNSVQLNTSSMSNSSALFTGRTNGWYGFVLEFPNFGWGYISDTLIFRFTFISDSVETNRQGWLVDNFWCQDYIEGIHENSKQDLSIAVSPNPTTDFLYVNIPGINENGTIEFFSISGERVLAEKTKSAQTILNLQNLSAGIYCCRFTGENGQISDKLVIRN